MNNLDKSYKNAFPFNLLSATDSLGRSLPNEKNTTPKRNGKYVGLFYFICNPSSTVQNTPVYDISGILETDPDAAYKPDSDLWGPSGARHFWGKPLFDYYTHDDEWVVRRHMQMLTQAEIDFIVFDTTNQSIYSDTVDVVLRVLDEYSQAGFDVPKIVYYTNTDSGKRINEIYEYLYKPGRYQHLWFSWDDKPLIIGDPDQCSDEIRRFFTFRLNQWPTEPDKKGGFPWISFHRPQTVYYADDGHPEVISVSVAQHPHILFGDSALYDEPSNRGRSFHENKNDYTRDACLWGYNIAEQWEYALEVDPDIIFITGWNEWTAGRFDGISERPVGFVDCADQEFSRDIEPMEGGHFDLYYLQMIGYIRLFKGVDAWPEISGQRTIDINGSLMQWDDISPQYLDFPGDDHGRSHPSFGGKILENLGSENDFRSMKVTHDDCHVYFYAECTKPVKPYHFKPWMWLLIKVEGSQAKSWLGYQFLVNQVVLNNTETFLQRCLGGFRWKTEARVKYSIDGEVIQLEIPKSLIDIPEGNQAFSIEFKWADSQKDLRIADQFYLHGSVAPYGLLNYRYSSATD